MIIFMGYILSLMQISQNSDWRQGPRIPMPIPPCWTAIRSGVAFLASGYLHSVGSAPVLMLQKIRQPGFGASRATRDICTAKIPPAIMTTPSKSQSPRCSPRKAAAIATPKNGLRK